MHVAVAVWLFAFCMFWTDFFPSDLLLHNLIILFSVCFI